MSDDQVRTVYPLIKTSAYTELTLCQNSETQIIDDYPHQSTTRRPPEFKIKTHESVLCAMLRQTYDQILRHYPGDKSNLGYSQAWLDYRTLELTDPTTITDDQIGMVIADRNQDGTWTWRENPRAVRVNIYVKCGDIIVNLFMSTFVRFVDLEVKYFGIMIIPGMLEQNFDIEDPNQFRTRHWMFAPQTSKMFKGQAEMTLYNQLSRDVL